MFTRRIILTFAICLMAAAVSAQSCADYNFDSTVPWTTNAQAGHAVGTHTVYETLYGECAYTSIGEANCASIK
jgi:polyisoprenoid-binding protein YceI